MTKMGIERAKGMQIHASASMCAVHAHIICASLTLLTLLRQPGRQFPSPSSSMHRSTRRRCLLQSPACIWLGALRAVVKLPMIHSCSSAAFSDNSHPKTHVSTIHFGSCWFCSARWLGFCHLDPRQVVGAPCVATAEP